MAMMLAPPPQWWRFESAAVVLQLHRPAAKDYQRQKTGIRNQEALLVRKEMITMMINYLHELGVHDPAVRRQFNVCQSLRALAASSTWAMANLK